LPVGTDAVPNRVGSVREDGSRFRANAHSCDETA
jgi:hypothetical protein